MRHDYSVKFLSQEDLVKAGCLDFETVIKVCENALVKEALGDGLFPEKSTMVFDQETQSRVNCLPAGGFSEEVCGVKWVSVFPNNPLNYKLPNLSALLLLSSLKTGVPFAVLDGGLLTGLRTAAVGAIAAKYLAKSSAESIGIIGAGEQAKFHLLSMLHVFPRIKLCKVSSRSKLSEMNFIKQMKIFKPDVEFVSCQMSPESAVVDSDIIVTAISEQSQVLKAEWISAGAFYCHVAGLEDEYSVPLKADKIVCDRWKFVKNREQTISQMYKEGLLSDGDIYADLFEIISGLKVGRENDSEFIYFNSVGLPLIDILLGNWMYKRCFDQQVGTDVCMRESSVFELSPQNWT